MLNSPDVEVTAVETAADALSALRGQAFDCLVLDLRLPDSSGLDLLETIKREFGLNELPVIVYTGKDLSAEEDARLKELAEAIIPKDARSPAALQEKAELFLHQVQGGRRVPA